MSKYRCPPNCPDRSFEPNCHNDCPIYKGQLEEVEKVKNNRKEDSIYTNYKRQVVIDTIDFLEKNSIKKWKRK